jgi:transglutaminase-like putative cysteine protease/tetratricopeptide (TPR) repeat protein
VLKLLLCTALVASAYAASPWDRPFSPDTRGILEAAKSPAAAEQGAVTLLLDRRYTVHAGGATDVTLRQVYRVDQKSAVDEWSSLEENYQPWYQQRPEIRARVISPDGSVHQLDPKTIAEEPVREYDSTIFSDSRTVRVPLPSVAPGAVVEYEVVIRDKTPLLDAGVVQHIRVPGHVPLVRFHASIHADPGVELRIASKLIPDGVIRRSSDRTGTQIECELGPLEPRKDYEANLPSDVAAYPYLSFSTGTSWQAVATRYQRIVDQRIQGADLKSLMDNVDVNGAPVVVAARLAAKLHAAVRYTGVEFGEASIMPNAPAEVLKRGYGDCKDKATLLVAMLRAAGLAADVALLDSGYGQDVDPDLPGMGRFDHAIVYVAANPPLWIDATANQTRVGWLPPVDQGRLALIANGTTTGLVKIPEAGSKDVWERNTIEVFVSEFGPGRIVETIEASGGSREQVLRGLHEGDAKKVRDTLESYVKQNFVAAKLGEFESMAPDDLSGPFHTKVEALRAAVSASTQDGAQVAANPWVMFSELPYALTSGDGSDDEEKPSAKDTPKLRRNDFVFPETPKIELHYRIHVPALFKPVSLPASEEINLGPVLYTRHFEFKDGVLDILYKLDVAKRRLTAAEFTSLRAALKKYTARQSEILNFVPETAECIAVGQHRKAIELLRQSLAKHPGDAMAHARYSRVLITAGMGSAALREARNATELDPTSGVAWQALAWAYQHDTFGRRMQGNWNYAESEKALRKAAELDPDDLVSRMDLAILLEHNQRGWRYAKDARLEEAIAAYRDIVKQPRGAGAAQNLAIALLWAGKPDEVKDELKKHNLQNSELLDVIKAIQEGPAQVVIATQSQQPDPRQRATYLGTVAATLMQLRKYEQAATIMRAAARAGNAPDLQARAELLSKVKPWEAALLKPSDPAYPAQRLLLEVTRQNLTREAIQPLLSRRIPGGSSDLSRGGDVLASARYEMRVVGMGEESMLDMIISMPDYSNEGDEAHGYRVRASVRGGGVMPPMYTIKEDDGYRFIAAGQDGLEGIGKLVLELVDQKAIKDAQWWLDKVAETVDARSDGTGRPAFVALWSGTTEQLRGPAAIRIAAASLIASSTKDDASVEVLQQARPKAPTALERAQVDKAICEGLAKSARWEDLVVAARRLGTLKTFSEESFRYLVKGLTGAGRWKELETEALKRAADNSRNMAAMRAVVTAKLRLGDTTGAMEWVRKITGSDAADEEEREFAAWSEMAAGKANAASLGALQKSQEKVSAKPAHQYVVAMMQAVLNMPEDAQQTLMQGLVREDYDGLGAAAWAAYGKICDQYGFPEDATEAYARARSVAAKNQDAAAQVLPLIPPK